MRVNLELEWRAMRSRVKWYDLFSLILLELEYVFPTLRAAGRADRLLLSHIGEEAFREMVRTGYLVVESRSHPGRQYRIPWEKDWLVAVCEGGEFFFLCVGFTVKLPRSAEILTHMLMIEGDEKAYLKAANRIE